jgi:hypothetical protein
MQRLDLGSDLRRALSPLSVLEDAGIEPDPWQRTALQNWQRDHLLLCSRQTGKSSTAAALATWIALYQAESTTLLVSRAERQSHELFRMCRLLYGKVPTAPRLVTDAATSMALPNNSRILALPGSEETVRGISGVNAIVVDEAARVDDDLMTAIRPMLATTNGPLWALTTPFGKRGWFYKAWLEDRGVERVKVTAEECPRISPEWLEKQRARMAPWEFDQEFGCIFADNDDQLFTAGLFTRAIARGEAPICL